MRELTDQDKAHLMVTLTSEGFNIYQEICEDEVKKFTTALLNLSSASPREEIVAAHTLAKAAAQFYTGVVNRVNTEINSYREKDAARVDNPLFIEESLDLDVEELADQLQGMPNLI